MSTFNIIIFGNEYFIEESDRINKDYTVELVLDRK